MHVRTIISSVSTATLLVAGLAGGIASAAAPSTVYVSTKKCSDSGSGTQQTPFCSIQKALNKVAPGGTVNVAAGTYSEQVTFKKSGEDNITLKGSGNGTVIQPPSDSTGGAIIDVKATGAVIENLAVSGYFPTTGGTNGEYGIDLEDGSSATIQNVKITQIGDSSTSGAQEGVGIEVGDSKGAATATITNATISAYQKNGINVKGTSNATINDTTVTGAGPTTYSAQNGIEVIDGATVNLDNDKVTGNDYTGTQNATALGLLLDTTAPVTVRQSTISKNQLNVYLDGITNSTFAQNTVNNAVNQGFDLTGGSNNNTFSQNTINSNGYAGFYVDTAGGSGNTVSQNSLHNPSPAYDILDFSNYPGSTTTTANTYTQDSCKNGYPQGVCE